MSSNEEGLVVCLMVMITGLVSFYFGQGIAVNEKHSKVIPLEKCAKYSEVDGTCVKVVKLKECLYE